SRISADDVWMHSFPVAAYLAGRLPCEYASARCSPVFLYSSPVFLELTSSHGVLEQDGSVRPNGAAYAAAALMLGDVKPHSYFRFGPDDSIRAHVYHKGEGALAAVWRESTNEWGAQNFFRMQQKMAPEKLTGSLKRIADTIGAERMHDVMAELRLAASPNSMRFYDLFANPVSYPATDGRILVAVSPSPLYIALPDGKPETLESVLRNAELGYVGSWSDCPTELDPAHSPWAHFTPKEPGNGFYGAWPQISGKGTVIKEVELGELNELIKEFEF
ncbi:MAG: hypothetical protein JXN60_01720, partial [Lentisphaerae bacterium]|nr:hypothetical protein [Lentisphaerota bacterium]